MMKLNCRFLYIAVMLGTLLLAATPLRAQGVSGDVIKIGIMNDQNGPYADNCGPGSVAAARLAVSDFGGTVNGKKIELVVADDQNKPDIGVAIALRWLDNEGVDAIVGCSASSIALAVQDIMKARKKPYLLAGTALSAFTNEKCSPMTTQWVQDTYALPRATVKSLLGQGLDTIPARRHANVNEGQNIGIVFSDRFLHQSQCFLPLKGRINSEFRAFSQGA